MSTKSRTFPFPLQVKLRTLTRGLSVCVALALTCTSTRIWAQDSSNLPDCVPAQKILPLQSSRGGGGGNPFDDKAIALQNGEITKIEIWAGDVVDAIKVTYGVSGFSPRHGGGLGQSGGTYKVLELKPGDFITEITGQSGDVVDKLCFSVNGGASTCYGGGGGKAFQVSSNGRPLRAIAGRSADSLDNIGFYFGNKASIDVGSIKYDDKTLESAIATAPDQRAYQILTNTSQTSPTVTYSDTTERSYSETIFWQNEVAESDTHSVGVKFTIGNKAGPTGGVEGSAELNYQYTHTNQVTKTNGNSKTTGVTNTKAYSTQIALPPGQSVRVTSNWKELTFDLPFSYYMNYWNDDDSQPVCRQLQKGVIRGIGSFGIRHTFEPIPTATVPAA